MQSHRPLAGSCGIEQPGDYPGREPPNRATLSEAKACSCAFAPHHLQHMIIFRRRSKVLSYDKFTGLDSVEHVYIRRIS
jgi:hypothetical protein